MFVLLQKMFKITKITTFISSFYRHVEHTKINFYKKAQRAFSNIILGGGGGKVILIINSLKLLYIDTASHSTKPNLLNTL